MTQQGFIFIDRRKGGDRRLDADPCQNLPLDLYHRMRRKNSDRRSSKRSLSEDYYAFLESAHSSMEHAFSCEEHSSTLTGTC